jgi:hypothetical protein
MLARMDGLARVNAADGAPPALPGGAGSIIVPEARDRTDSPSPTSPDTDNDGLRDGEEVTTRHTTCSVGVSSGK